MCITAGEDYFLSLRCFWKSSQRQKSVMHPNATARKQACFPALFSSLRIFLMVLSFITVSPSCSEDSDPYRSKNDYDNTCSLDPEWHMFSLALRGNVLWSLLRCLLWETKIVLWCLLQTREWARGILLLQVLRWREMSRNGTGVPMILFAWVLSFWSS